MQLEDILIKGVYTRRILTRNDGTLFIDKEITHIKKPILRYIDNEICIQQSNKVSWLNYKVKDYRITWAFNKEDFMSEEEVSKV